jgi:3-phosphoinositide dependent protein kinase-1
VTPKKKQKTRELILTTNRVVCMKVEKGGRSMNTKLELSTQRPVEKEKEKDKNDKDKEKDKKKVKEKEKETSNSIISVDLKGEREFVILTVSLSTPHSFV